MQLLKQFEALWESSDSSPDVFAFLAEYEDAQAEEVMAVLVVDQRRRWSTDSPLKVEDYLERLPKFGEVASSKLELAVAEFRIRIAGNTPPSVDEFTSRFSDIGDTLRLRLEEAMLATLSRDSWFCDQNLGRYRLSRWLGKGTYGVVWLAFDSELHRKVAIKIPNTERFIDPSDRETFLVEARTVATLEHANIVPVYDVGRTVDGNVYVVSKYIDGGTLAQLVKQSRPDYQESARIIFACASALGYAHKEGIVHRDVKPANILIENRSGTPFLANFGLAIRKEDFSQRSGFIGTPAYMSPEQARGDGHRIDSRSDVFALGVVLYELLTGKPPFRGKTRSELFNQIISETPKHPRDVDRAIPTKLECICLHALSKHASDRYATAEEMADDLLHWIESREHEAKDVQIYHDESGVDFHRAIAKLDRSNGAGATGRNHALVRGLVAISALASFAIIAYSLCNQLPVIDLPSTNAPTASANHPAIGDYNEIDLADAVNLESSNPAIRRAAEIKRAEDLAFKKITALTEQVNRLGTLADYDGRISEQIMAAFDDCSEAVRHHAVTSINSRLLEDPKITLSRAQMHYLYSATSVYQNDFPSPEPSYRIREIASEILTRLTGEVHRPIPNQFESPNSIVEFQSIQQHIDSVRRDLIFEPIPEKFDPRDLESEVPVIRGKAEFDQKLLSRSHKLAAMNYIAKDNWTTCDNKDGSVTAAILAACQDADAAVRFEAVRLIAIQLSKESESGAAKKLKDVLLSMQQDEHPTVQNLCRATLQWTLDQSRSR